MFLIDFRLEIKRGDKSGKLSDVPREKYETSEAAIFSVVFKYSNIASNVSIQNTVWASLSLLILFGTYFYTHVSLISDLKVTSSKAPFALLFYRGKREKEREWFFAVFWPPSSDEPGWYLVDVTTTCRRWVWGRSWGQSWGQLWGLWGSWKSVVLSLALLFSFAIFFFFLFLLFWSAVCASASQKGEMRQRLL